MDTQKTPENRTIGLFYDIHEVVYIVWLKHGIIHITEHFKFSSTDEMLNRNNIIMLAKRLNQHDALFYTTGHLKENIHRLKMAHIIKVIKENLKSDVKITEVSLTKAINHLEDNYPEIKKSCRYYYAKALAYYGQ
jgi:hypothetical protein